MLQWRATTAEGQGADLHAPPIASGSPRLTGTLPVLGGKHVAFPLAGPRPHFLHLLLP